LNFFHSPERTQYTLASTVVKEFHGRATIAICVSSRKDMRQLAFEANRQIALLILGNESLVKLGESVGRFALAKVHQRWDITLPASDHQLV
jgi:hypothetical protein